MAAARSRRRNLHARTWSTSSILSGWPSCGPCHTTRRTWPLHPTLLTPRHGLRARVRERKMKETILDVLLFLFENYFYDDPDAVRDRDSLQHGLIQAGFSPTEISKAF